MNPFSVLDSDSDDEKPKPSAAKSKENKAVDNKKPKPVNTIASGGGAKKSTAPAPKKEQTGIAPGEAEEIPAKEKLRDSGHGSKQKSENRSKNRAGKKADGNQKNNNRRSGDSDAQQKKVSKGGQGARNWGSDEAEARAANKDGRIEFDVADDYDGDEGKAPVESEPEPEPEPITFTLDEYMAQKAGEKKNEDVFGAIKERVVDSNVEGKRVNDDGIQDYLVIGGLKENKELKSKKEKSKQVLKIGFLGGSDPEQSNTQDGDKKYSASNDAHRKTHRGHRGGVPSHHARGRGGKANFDVTDQSAFPSLG